MNTEYRYRRKIGKFCWVFSPKSKAHSLRSALVCRVSRRYFAGVVFGGGGAQPVRIFFDCWAMYLRVRVAADITYSFAFSQIQMWVLMVTPFRHQSDTIISY
jgi:hypothetical protein